MSAINFQTPSQTNYFFSNGVVLSLHVTQTTLIQITAIATLALACIAYNYTCKSRSELYRKENEYIQKDSEYSTKDKRYFEKDKEYSGKDKEYSGKDKEYLEKDKEYSKTRELNGYLKSTCESVQKENIRIKTLIAQKNTVGIEKPAEPRWKVLGKNALYYVQLAATINSVPAIANNAWKGCAVVINLFKGK